MSNFLKSIEQLIAMYSSQLDIYTGILQMGDQEKTLLAEGNIPQLVKLLEKKQQLLVNITEFEDNISKEQANIAEYCSLAEFSLPKIKNVAPQSHQPALEELEQKLGELVVVLEKLEKQEQTHENLLRNYSHQLKTSTVKVKPGAGSVKAAYAKFTEGENCGKKS